MQRVKRRNYQKTCVSIDVCDVVCNPVCMYITLSASISLSCSCIPQLIVLSSLPQLVTFFKHYTFQKNPSLSNTNKNKHTSCNKTFKHPLSTLSLHTYSDKISAFSNFVMMGWTPTVQIILILMSCFIWFRFAQSKMLQQESEFLGYYFVCMLTTS